MSTQTIFRTVGYTSQSTDISVVQNAASTAPGDPILGLAYNTANLVCYYRTGGGGTLTQINLVTQTAAGAYSSGGFVKIDDTHAPGQYRFDIPNAVLASAGEVSITFYWRSRRHRGKYGNSHGQGHCYRIGFLYGGVHFSSDYADDRELCGGEHCSNLGTSGLFDPAVAHRFLMERDDADGDEVRRDHNRSHINVKQ